MKTAHRLGMRTVAVYSEADAGARHVRLADEGREARGSGGERSLQWPAKKIIAAAHDAPSPGHPPWLRLPLGERRFRGGLRSGGYRIHRPAPARSAPWDRKSAAKT